MKKKKKILIVAPSNKGTIAICSLNLLRALQLYSDAEVKCVTVYMLDAGLKEYDGCDYCMTTNSHSGLKDLFKIKKQISWLKSIKKEFKPDITISTLFSTSTLNVLAGGNDEKIGIFHSPHQQAKAFGKISYLVTLTTYNFIYPALDKLYCVSNEVKRSITDAFPTIKKEKVDVVYNAHDIAGIRKKAEEELTDKIEKELFSKPVLLYIGRFDANKAPERALKAFAKAEISKDCQLVYVGGGNEKYAERLKEEAKELGVADRIHLLGQQSNPYKYLLRAKALVSSSYSEGLPGVMIESLILNKPIVTTNSSEGIWEILSCSEDYRKNLRDIYITHDSVITPNNRDEEDIKHFSKGIAIVMNNPDAKPDTQFVEKVTFEAIAESFK